MKRRRVLQGLGAVAGSGALTSGWLHAGLAQTDPVLPSVPNQVPDPLDPLSSPPNPAPEQGSEVEFTQQDATSAPTPEPAPSPGNTPDPTQTTLPSLPPGSLGLTWLNHSCVLVEADGLRILVNPFRSIGCTEGYPPPAVGADVVLLSSRLFDEGYVRVVPGNPRVLFQPGDYRIEGLRIQGVRMAHDNSTSNSDRFGINVGWRWTQADIDIVHLGGAAAPITREQSILLAQPDILFVPVGGGVKNYDPERAEAAIAELQPRLVIPTMYRTEAAGADCDLVGLDQFLERFPLPSIQFSPSRSVILTADKLPTSGPVILSFEAT